MLVLVWRVVWRMAMTGFYVALGLAALLYFILA